MASTWTEADLQLAIEEIAKSDTPKYMVTSKRHGVPRQTPRNRFLGKTMSRQEAMSEYHQSLTTAQKEAPMKPIYRLTNRGLPSTNSIVRDLAEEINGRSVGKDWSNEFVR